MSGSEESCSTRCADSETVQFALDLLANRIREGDLQLWKDEGKDVATFMR